MAVDIDDVAGDILINDLYRERKSMLRDIEDAKEAGDANALARAAREANKLQLEIDRLTGENQPRQQQQELLDSERAYLDNRARLGDNWRDHPDDFVHASARALAAGFQRGSPQYFASITGSIEHNGDGRQPVLDQRTAAQISGIDDATYAAGAARLAALKRSGHYQD